MNEIFQYYSRFPVAHVFFVREVGRIVESRNFVLSRDNEVDRFEKLEDNLKPIGLRTELRFDEIRIKGGGKNGLIRYGALTNDGRHLESHGC